MPIVTERKACLVVGAGPAGLECAWTLLRAGHQVTIADARDEAGGRVTLEARLPGLAAWARVRDHRLYQIQQCADADLYLSSPMTPDDIEGFEAENIIIATGSIWRSDGVGSTNSLSLALGDDVLTPDDVMAGREIPIKPDPVIIYDDDHFYMASVIAEKFSNVGHRVAYATPLPTVATWTDLTLEQGRIIERLNDLGVALHVNVKLTEAHVYKSVLTGEAIDMPSGPLVLVGARQPEDHLHQSLKARQPDRSVWIAGDCHVPGTIQAAVLSGHRTARQILGDTHAGNAFRRDIPVAV